MYITRLTKVAKLGPYDEKYGQSYWCDTESESLPVKFNSMSPDFKEGDVISTEEKTLKKSMKGTEYWQYKKVKALESDAGSLLTADSSPDASVYHAASQNAPQVPQNSSPGNPDVSFLLQSVLDLTKQANAKLDKLLGLDEPTQRPYDVATEPLPDEPLGGIDLE